MKINNVYIHGSFDHRKKNDRTFPWTNKNLYIFDNKIMLKRNSFSLSLTKNIRSVLELKKLNVILKNLFKKEIGATIRNLTWKISNVHESIAVPCTPRKILGDMLVKLRDQMGVSYLQVTQEQNTPLAAKLDDVIAKCDELAFIALRLALPDRSTSVKIQLGKTRDTAEITIIISKFTDLAVKLIKFLETYHHG